ncbi:Leo1-like protein-domain-containing protein [Xylariaceae sp. FL1272]|nr:Leo1-like protein-domain-containing protein [Xylariaceae sp. FL1272]
MSDSEDPLDNIADEGGDDLFGDDEPDATSEKDGRVLSDEDLASDNEAPRRSRTHEDEDEDEDMQDAETRRIFVHDIKLGRHRIPKAKNGQMQSMRVPEFLQFNPFPYDPENFEPTADDMQNAKSDLPKSVVRFQRNAATGELTSNTNIHRWSDGSITISVGGEHYEIQTKKMAPPANQKKYSETDDAHYYVAAPQMEQEVLVTVGHVNEQYTVLQTRNMRDDAVEKFAERMAALGRGQRQSAGNMIVNTTRDPELQKKEAEMAEKERMKAQRRRETAAARVDSRAGGYRSGGLSVNDLEGGRRGAGGSRKKGAGGGTRSKRRRPEYDSDDDLPSGTRRQDEYDREDDFIAPSDDDQMSDLHDDDEEEDILDDDEEEEEAPRKKRQKTVEVEDDDADADADADADLDDLDAPAPAEAPRHRRRRIVEDEDEDE